MEERQEVAASPDVTTPLAPVSSSERIDSIDILRGAALLGILLMNILSFGLPLAAYMNPTVAGGSTGANLAAWVLQYVLFDGKMRAIFSLVFGVGVVILTSRAEARGQGMLGADTHYRRTLWLMLFGLLHAYLIWYGDILYPYALLALVLYPLRRLRPRTLMIVAGVQFVILTGWYVGDGFLLRSLKSSAEEARIAAERGDKLTDEQVAAQREWEDRMRDIRPTPELVQKEIDAYRGGYFESLAQRAGTVMRWHSMPFYFPFMFDMLGMMLIGMALFKADILSANRSLRYYAVMAAVGYVVGIPINAWAAWRAVQHNFEPTLFAFDITTYQAGRVAVSLAHVALILLVVKSGALQWLTRPLAAVGQMAFSNYIFHSLVCTFFFYGIGLGKFARLERYELYYLVGAIWVFQLIVSPIWLRHFRFGPLEWGWRSLTYWQRQPMRRVSRVRSQEPEVSSQEVG